MTFGGVAPLLLYWPSSTVEGHVAVGGMKNLVNFELYSGDFELHSGDFELHSGNSELHSELHSDDPASFTVQVSLASRQKFTAP